MRTTLPLLLLLAACHHAEPAPTPTPEVLAPAVDAAPAEEVATVPPDAAPVEETVPPAPTRPADWDVADDGLDAAITDLAAQLKKGGDKDAIGSLILRGRLASLEWRRTCPGADHGVCQQAPKASKASHCGTANINAPIAKKRSGDKVPLASLKKVVTLWNDGALLDAAGETSGERASQAAFVAGDAMLALDDTRLETFMAIVAPTGLDFEKAKEKSLKKFTAWFETLSKAAVEARTGYEKLVADARITALAPEVRIAAIARIAQLHTAFARAVLLLDIPADVGKDPEAMSAYCTILADKVVPLQEAATQAWQSCVDEAKKAGVTGTWPELCSARLDAVMDLN